MSISSQTMETEQANGKFVVKSNLTRMIARDNFSAKIFFGTTGI